MHVLVWEFEVSPGRQADFERAYGPHGEWVRLFQSAPGFVGTELLKESGRYVTIDRWLSKEQYETFRASKDAEYAAIDRSCEALTARETPIGAFTSVAVRTN